MIAAPSRWLVVAALGLSGCGQGREASAGTSRSVAADGPTRAEAAVLVRLVDEDPARSPLSDVQSAIDDDRPVRAAELLETTAIPAARRAAADARSVGVTTAASRALRDGLVAALDARTVALEAYARALARGPVEDLELLDAMRAVRRAEASLADAYDAAVAARDGRSASGSTGAAP